ncbi:TetR/AcrR family transcriptional regulator [Streptomyces sp. NPDC005485]|uniref:TetR/AcrR family transcriptional regulator n=1 Tax=Streptomyces sp. NPDC005485 TaxID=3155591 RepID=UPI0033A505E6
MDPRERILKAATDLLVSSADADFSTRAVCEAAGVGAPVLYRHFGDKAGLLSAVVNRGFEEYLASKRAARPSADPVQDVRDGWDNHVRFALAHPNHYRVMFSPGLPVPPDALNEAHQLLRETLDRCAVAGRLTVALEAATQMVMSANTGVALSLVARAAHYPDTEFSGRVRDAVIDSITQPLAQEEQPSAAADGVPAAAATLGARLRVAPPAALSAAETGLLHQWLDTLARGDGSA